MGDSNNPYSSPTDTPSPQDLWNADLLSESFDPSDAIRIAGQVTPKEVFAAFRLHAGMRGILIPYVVFLVIVGMLAWISIPSGTEAIPFFIFSVVFICLLYLSLYIYRYRFIRRQWNNRRGVCEYTERLISPQGMQSRTSNTSKFLRWDACGQFKLSNQILTIYHNPPTMFYILPRRQFATEADWQECLQIMSQNLTQR